MAYEATTTVGSGINPAKNALPVNPTDGERHLRGTAVVVLNPEDNSAGMSGLVTQLTVSGVAVKLPSSPLSYRRAVAIRNFNSTSGVLYIGFDSAVTTSNGYPLDAGESLPLQMNGAVDVWGVADTSVDARIIELA